MSQHYADDIAMGRGGPRRLQIAGRPAPASSVSYVLLEEPGEPVQMHWVSGSAGVSGRLVPHYRRGCPHCHESAEEPKPLWYLGAAEKSGRLVIVELTEKCYESALAAARRIPARGASIDLFGVPEDVAQFTGLLITISRGAGRSQRVLRCDQRVTVQPGMWTYHTREELARVWGVPIRPRLYREGTG